MWLQKFELTWAYNPEISFPTVRRAWLNHVEEENKNRYLLCTLFQDSFLFCKNSVKAKCNQEGEYVLLKYQSAMRTSLIICKKHPLSHFQTIKSYYCVKTSGIWGLPLIFTSFSRRYQELTCVGALERQLETELEKVSITIYVCKNPFQV